MKRLLIAEDESSVRKGMINAIDWASLNVTICGEAENGSEALTLARALKPHIILTDIRMPVMDGLTFIAQLKTEQPNVEVIVFSGYDDFDYAVQAIRLGVSEYLLKPVRASDLMRAVQNLCQNINENQNRLLNSQVSDQLVAKNLASLQFRFLTQLFAAPDFDKTILNKAQALSIQTDGPCFQIVLLDIDNYIMQRDYWTGFEQETLMFAIANITEEIIGKDWHPTICYSESSYLILLLSGELVDLTELIRRCELIKKYVGKYLNTSITIGISQPCLLIHEISRSYQQARQAVKSKSLHGKNQVIAAGALVSDPGLMHLTNQVANNRDYLTAIKSLNSERIKQVIQERLNKFQNNLAKFELLKVECIKLLISAAAQFEEMGIDINKHFDGFFNPVDQINQLETIIECRLYVETEIDRMLKMINADKSDLYKTVVQATIDFIKKHYQDEINLESAAKELFISASYLSRVFKEETGVNFVTWINQYRIKQAKNLLGDLSLKTYMIAEKVGYHDYRYFNYNFKKITGHTAKEYRAINFNSGQDNSGQDDE